MLSIRAAELSDAPRFAEIYAPYVRNTTVSYEYEPVSPEEFAGRMAEIMKRYPYLAAEAEGRVIGYAYASPYHSRRAFAWSCELSVYVDENERGRGAGTALYEKLLELLTGMNYRVAYGVIDVPNEASFALHEKLGFRQTAVFPDIGFKHGRWLTMAVLEKRLGEQPEKAPPPVLTDWRGLL